MDKLGLNNLNNMHFDMLTEIGNIGAGNAATSLSSLLSKRIDMAVPKVDIVDIRETSEILGGPEKQVVGILFEMQDDVEGMLLFVLEQQFAYHILNNLFDDKINNFDSLNEINISALKEVANIMAGSFTSAISTLTDLKIGLSVPYFNIDMVGAIMNVPATLFGIVGDKVLLIEEEFFGGNSSINSYLVLVPTVESLNKIIDKSGQI